ncbi:MAG TPA: sigma 54-interacting transcriptional regulator [Spirochaetales bacterium]|nr:sigma 54-interacting transcriptional regulator [Spirochaetales bacterium]HQK33492.1 sigma 54-interacting transcriptional regulator [Spirochaetales bacterium]HRV27281.1 sigma 54-interacting transcriptional regulator [Spirochaetia bacterium]
MLTKIDPVKFETLLEINTLINSNYGDATKLLTQILESATRLTEGEASSLVLKNQDDGKLYFEIALGPKGRDVKKFCLNPGEGIAGWVAERGQSLIVNDVETDSRFYSEISKSIDFPTYSILAVPMLIRDKCVGVIEILNKKNNKYFTQDDLEWLEIFAVQAAIAIENAHYFEKAKEEIGFLRNQISEDKGYHVLIAKSPEILSKLELISRIAQTDSSVLILGESGVGKELFAEQIHLQSLRKNGPFIRVNCAALPEGLLESELFGHVKGAFTDAIQNRKGRFELADGGTIFLDEIGDLPLKLQAKLLRVLQQKTFEKVGSSETISVDVRIVAATNKNIEELVKKGEFRSDLYYRLNVLPIHIPPLRSRKEDIIELANHFLKKFSRETKKQINGFTKDAIDAMLSYSWPGNVRELENAIERAIVITKEKLISSHDLLIGTKNDDIAVYKGMNLKDALNIFKKHFIQAALESHNWNQTETARELDIQRTYLSRLIKELNITVQKE